MSNLYNQAIIVYSRLMQKAITCTCSCIYFSQLYLTSPATDCGDPGTPTNGQRSLSSTTNNSVVTYSCDVGYKLQGSNSRTCQSDGQWSASVPQCNGMSFKECAVIVAA